MKVRFYCDVPPNYNPKSSSPIYLCAGTMSPTWKKGEGFTRIAFDVDMPPELVVPLFDVQAPMSTAMIIESEVE